MSDENPVNRLTAKLASRFEYTGTLPRKPRIVQIISHGPQPASMYGLDENGIVYICVGSTERGTDYNMKWEKWINPNLPD